MLPVPGGRPEAQLEARLAERPHALLGEPSQAGRAQRQSPNGLAAHGNPSSARTSNMPERDAAAEILRGVDLEGYTIIADKGFAGADFQQFVADFGGRLLRPDRRTNRAGMEIARSDPPVDRIGRPQAHRLRPLNGSVI